MELSLNEQYLTIDGDTYLIAHKTCCLSRLCRQSRIWYNAEIFYAILAYICELFLI